MHNDVTQVYEYYLERTKTVEMLRGDHILRVHFFDKKSAAWSIPGIMYVNVFQCCRYQAKLREEVIEELKWGVDRSSAAGQITDFVDRSMCVWCTLLGQLASLYIVKGRFWPMWTTRQRSRNRVRYWSEFCAMSLSGIWVSVAFYVLLVRLWFCIDCRSAVDHVCSQYFDSDNMGSTRFIDRIQASVQHIMVSLPSISCVSCAWLYSLATHCRYHAIFYPFAAVHIFFSFLLVLAHFLIYPPSIQPILASAVKVLKFVLLLKF